MAKLSRMKGTTSQIFHIFVQDSSSTTGAGLTGLTYNSASLACKYINSGGTLSGSITPQDITTLGTYQAPTANTNIRFKEVNSASPTQGIYELHVHDDWMNLTGGNLIIMLGGATNMAPVRLEIDLGADYFVRYKVVTDTTTGLTSIYGPTNLLYSGFAYSDSAGTVLYNGTSAINNTAYLT